MQSSLARGKVTELQMLKRLAVFLGQKGAERSLCSEYIFFVHHKDVRMGRGFLLEHKLGVPEFETTKVYHIVISKSIV